MSYEKAEDGAYKPVYEKLPMRSTYEEITTKLVLQSDEFEKLIKNLDMSDKDKRIWMGSSVQNNVVKEILKKVSILVECENINVKYEIIYNVSFEAQHNHVYIEDIKSASLSEDDVKYLKETDA